MQYVQIPRERVGVLIGEGGETKRLLEERTKTSLVLDDTSVSVEGESLDEWVAMDIVKAIGRGFSPEKAMFLLNEDVSLEVLSITDIVGGSAKNMARVKGRVIGREGKIRKRIEDLTGVYVSVYGKTVSIIGSLGAVDVAREAIIKLLSGSPHSNVFKFLEKQRSLGKID